MFFFSSCKGGNERSVFLAGGNAWTLFSEYIEALKQNKIKYGLRSIKVQFFDGKQLITIEFDWRDWLTGESAMKMWETKLKKYEAIYNQSELNRAKNLNIDIYCNAIEENFVRIDGKIIKSNINLTNNTIEATTSGGPTVNKTVCSADSNRYVDLGIQFAMNKNYENAVKELRQAISISPKCALAYANLVSVYIEKKDYNLAIDTYKEGLKNAGDDGFLHYNGAIAHIYRKEYDYALNSIEKAIKLGFTNPEYYKKSDLYPLFQHKKKEFCKILNENKVIIKQCL
jgi:tetratricopeptide (TPR) repeat protein